MGWNKITVRQYIDLREVNNNIKELEALPKSPEVNLQILEQKAKKLSLIFEKPVKYFEGLSFDKLETSYKIALQIEAEPMPSELKPVLTINGKSYRAITDPSKFNVCSYLAYQLYGKDIRGNMAKILTWIYREEGHGPHDEPEDHEPDMLAAKLTDVAGCFFLLSRKYRKWKAAIPVYNDHLMTIAEQTMREAITWAKSQQHTDGSTPLKESLIQPLV